ncbi:MAG TPA: hypothetical protein VFV67_16320 [Actinophytocola sp.]|uniref:hypothetical protein n=1 Tax=Actinophytocola sp. TaxID=1872138 RepID=UPI002DBE4349|nr:hypothetical protein [Actinophytocola sp.]HEU5472220.1 hypothetical protein [Actinophytocola sp.]
MPCPDRHAALQMIKNVAYGWRQAVFFLSFCEREVQEVAIGTLRDRVTEAGLVRFAPAVDGLAHVVAGGAFTGTNRGGPGRRLLGWSVGPHWCLAGEPRPAPR